MLADCEAEAARAVSLRCTRSVASECADHIVRGTTRRPAKSLMEKRAAKREKKASRVFRI
jgi:hypothetical protein